MKYFRMHQNEWVECDYNANSKHIILYDLIDNVMTPIGIGMY